MKETEEQKKKRHARVDIQNALDSLVTAHCYWMDTKNEEEAFKQAMNNY